MEGTAAAGADDVATAATGWSLIAPETLDHVFEFCTVLDVARAEAVCKHWNAAVSDCDVWLRLVKRRWHEPTTKRHTRLRREERKRWDRTYREWLSSGRMPRSALAPRHSGIFGRGAHVVRAHGLGTAQCPVGLGLQGWLVLAHSADTRLRPAPSQGGGAALEQVARVWGRSHWLQIRLLLQNAAVPPSCTPAARDAENVGHDSDDDGDDGGSRVAVAAAGESSQTSASSSSSSTTPTTTSTATTATTNSSSSLCPVLGWPMTPVLVSAAGVRMRMRDGGHRPCFPLGGPTVVAVNGKALGDRSAVAESKASSSASHSDHSDEEAAAHEHDFHGGVCACGTHRLGLSVARGVVEWQSQRSTVVLAAEESAVLEVWAPFGEEVLHEPEALDRCSYLEVPVRRADGVGQATTLRVHIAPDRQVWDRYRYAPGGNLYLKDE